MAFIETIRYRAGGPVVAAMYLRQQSAWGYVPNYARVFCHRPEIMALWAGLLAEIKRPMDRRRFELVTFAAAHELRHTACTMAHGRKLREFFSDDEIVALAEGRFTGGGWGRRPTRPWSISPARWRATPPGSRRRRWTRLKAQGLSDAEVFDVAAAAAARAFFTGLLDALGVLLDSPFLALEEGLRGPLTVGRPIDHRNAWR